MEKEIPRPSSARPSADWATRAQAWRGDRRVAGAVLACVAVAAGVAWYRAGSTAAAPPASAPPASVATRGVSTTRPDRATTTTGAAARLLLIVDVVGAVRRNGIVRLRAGARVVDALAAAGGVTADADLVRLNLAAPVADGARIAVPRLGAPVPAVDPVAVTGAPDSGGAGGGTPSPSSPVDLNTATADQLDALPGIGPATAAAIIADRVANGRFRSVDDLGRVRGIGDAKLAQLRGLVTV